MGNQLGIKIRNLRKDHRLTQQQVADKLGLAGATISLYEKGSNDPDIKTILQLSKLFGVRGFYLLMYLWTDLQYKEINMVKEMVHIMDDLNMFCEEMMVDSKEKDIAYVQFYSPEGRHFIKMWKEVFEMSFYSEYCSLSENDQKSFLRDVKLLWELKLYKSAFND